MTAERWEQAWRLFDEALARPPAERDAWLVRCTVDDPGLYDQVSRWLRADHAAADFLEDSWLAGEVLQAPDLLGRRLGSCRIVERLGQGGMGTVYLAHQADDIFDRDVAVKVLSWRPFGEEARARFQVEQQALGRLDHPAVARIHTGGVTDEGFPYLVMEHVPGVPLDRYCAEHDLSVAQRVALLRRVCAGVSASHQRLIVHSDLKPSNILVRHDGQPKLLDFGIARLLDADGSPVDDASDALFRPLTPRYAAPEQLRGEPASTASDVYALGVLLHQLLCDALPPKGGEGIVPPSVIVAAQPSRARAVRGDLDAIVMRALEVEPAARYPSVESLDRDLGRYLARQPVEARAGGRAYRVGKLVRRNPWPVATAAAVLLALVAAIGALWLDQRRIERERQSLLEVARFFFGVFEQSGPWVTEGAHVTLEEALTRSASHLADGPPGEPHVQAALSSVLGEIYLELGEPEQAFEWSRRAHDQQAVLWGKRSWEAASSLDVVGAALREQGELARAEVAGREALAALREASSADPRLVIRALNNLVDLQCWRGAYEAAAPVSTEALAWARRALPSGDPEMIEALLQHAQVLRHTDALPQAVALYREAGERLEDDYPEGHPQLALLHNNLAGIYGEQGDVAAQVASLERADALYASLFGDDHYQRVRPLLGLAIVAKNRGEVAQAIDHYRRAVVIGQATTSPSFILRPTASLASYLIARDRCPEAEDVLRSGLDRLAERVEKPWRYFDAQSLLGESLLCQGRRRDAEGELRAALAGLEPMRARAANAHGRAVARLARLAE